MIVALRREIDRSGLFDRFGPADIVHRYRCTYGVGEEVGIDEVKRHAALEGELTDALLASAADNRAEKFFWAYTRLYSELPWLASTGGGGGGELWASLLRPGASIYEIGSGAGHLINYLVGRGFKCVGTDIASERSDVARSGGGEVVWGVTDGLHLTRYAEPGSFDYVISDQVVEHLHPDDVVLHFREARELLKTGGEYIVRTPYAPLGPFDLSAVFGCDEAIFMHLHEFNVAELVSVAKQAGFDEIRGVFPIPKANRVVRSEAYLKYMLAIDKLVRGARDRRGARALLRKFSRYLLIRGNIWLCLAK